MAKNKRKCECAFEYCCDHCWAEAAIIEPCPVKNCQNPEGHSGKHGPLNNTQTIEISEASLLGKE